MKKKFTTISLALVTLITSSAFILSYQSTGMPGFTGSPNEGTCNSCHGGGTSAAAGTTISATPSFTNNEYVAGENYTITVSLEAAGFTRYGFGCEILNATSANAGTMHTQGSGVKFLNSASRRNAIHTTPKTGNAAVNFTFEWTAPTNGDDATIYVAGNAVNGNGQTSGDFPMTPITLALTGDPLVIVDPVGIKENKSNTLSQLSVYPNPAKTVVSASYYLSTTQNVQIQLLSISGAVVKDFQAKAQTPGAHTQILDVHDVQSGLYFLKISGDNQSSGQRLVTIQ